MYTDFLPNYDHIFSLQYGLLIIYFNKLINLIKIIIIYNKIIKDINICPFLTLYTYLCIINVKVITIYRNYFTKYSLKIILYST